MLKSKAAKAIATGELPLIHASLYFTGEGKGERCPLCQMIIATDETSASTEAPSGIITMHGDCFRGWQEAVEDSARVAIFERRARSRPEN
ncbi:MAG: hypothetical protein EOP18_09200 [Rhizobiaceae bacterium]|nr:MAG: hypothetical protein EOP18_09200 [Rhizobiaceae bacterium]